MKKIVPRYIVIKSHKSIDNRNNLKLAREIRHNMYNQKSKGSIKYPLIRVRMTAAPLC